MKDPNVEVPMNKTTVIPDPESHFSFSTKLMVLAIDLYQEEAPRDFCPYTIFVHKKLTQFVDSRKEMTAQSYRFFVEHAYNQFFQHEAFHQSARARTRVKDIHGGDFHTSKKLDGYIWIASDSKFKQVWKDQADECNMDDEDDAEDDEEVELLHVFTKAGCCRETSGKRRCKLSAARGNIPTNRRLCSARETYVGDQKWSNT